MNRQLFEMLLESRLRDLIDKDRKQAKILFTNNPEYNPDLNRIAIYDNPEHWPSRIVACDQMQMLLNRIDWSQDGQNLSLPQCELPTLELNK